MPENRHLRFLLTLLYIILGVLGAYLTVRYLLRWLLPFAIAFLAASILRKPVMLLTKKLHLSKTFVSIIMVLFLYGVIGSAVVLLLIFLVDQLREFAADLPGYLSAVPAVLDQLWQNVLSILNRLPAALRNPVVKFVEGMASGNSLPSMDVDVGSVFGTVKSVAVSIPTILIFTIAMIVSTFYLVNDYDRIVHFLASQLPERIRESGTRLKNHMVTTLGRWLRGMCVIILITFFELSIAFLLMRLDHAIVLAGLVAIIDALPVFGTGTVLIPWTVFALLTGNFSRAIFVILTYLIITAIRNIIEPRILGDHIGLNPLVMLVCFYVGFVTMGILGMFLLPVTMIALEKLQEWGYIHLWKNPAPKPEPQPVEPLRSVLARKWKKK
ncbi:MAG: sporulation integral membrane protein YtvI [Ruminococcaceae bacterium]|nr:sporulation integral membrane protein YtvI [Oscillospiraceae bacterium]